MHNHCVVWSLKPKRVKLPYCYTYNYKKNRIDTTDAELSFPNIFYRITF